MKNKQTYKTLFNMNTFGKKVFPMLVFLGILVPSSVVLAATTTITNNTSGSISDNNCINRTFNMTSLVTITDIMIEINIDHTYRADLDIDLSSPQGTSVDLTSDNGTSRNNLYVKFDDAASKSITDDNRKHTETVDRRSEQALGAFDGQDAQGTWTLQICDDENGDRGTFNYAVLDINDTPPPAPLPIESDLSVNLQMDECYWLGGANGVTDDVKDNSGNGLDAQSRNKANNIEAASKICRAGGFVNTYTNQSESDAVYYPNNTTAENNIGKDAPFSISAWVYRHNNDKWMAAVIKVSNDDWTDGWGLEHRSGSGSNIDFFVGDHNTYARASLSNDVWTHIVGTYDGSTIKIYKNGNFVTSTTQSTYSPGALALSVGDDISGSSTDDRWQGNIDEVKIWNRALHDAEIMDMYNKEESGLNFDGTTRSCKPCNGSSISAHSWDLIGIPADSRTTPLTVNDVFGDDMNGTFGTDWKIYKRIYSSTDNSSSYEELALNDTLDFGQGYWLGSSLNSEWYVDGTPSVDYNSTSSDCTASQCVEIDLTSVTHDFAVDGDDGTGPYRYNMSGFPGMTKPVNWADCRFIIDGVAYTPTDANASGFANKQIWLYNGTGTDESNSYITCDDTMICKLVPFKGFSVELHGATKNKTVKLLIPQE